MDPLSLASLGLGAASLAIQVFASCVKGYQVLIEVEAMPEKYEHLRIRLQIEQARFLDWGDKIGLVEEMLERPSPAFKLHRGPVIAMLMEIQRLFRECLRIEATFNTASEATAANHVDDGGEATDPQVHQPPERRKAMLKKTLRFFDRVRHVQKRLHWAMIKHDIFEKMIHDLIRFNDSIVSLLDRGSIDELHELQLQNQLVAIQLCTQIDELKRLSLAMQLKLEKNDPGPAEHGGVSPSALVALQQDSENANVASLASFKAQQTSLYSGVSSADVNAITLSEITLLDDVAMRSEAKYQNKRVWIEWKNVDSDARTTVKLKMIEERIKKLTILLAASGKPALFKSPKCLGFCRDFDQGKSRYGLIFERPEGQSPTTQLVSLLTLLNKKEKTSLTRKVALAHAIAQSLMYLHSVNWLHKGLRSDNIVFFAAAGQEPDFEAPILVGFDYARPDLSHEETDKPRGSFEHNLYRHPEALGAHNPRSRKSHDIYSFGVILTEIALWQPIKDAVCEPGKQDSRRMSIGKFRQALLDRQFLASVEACAGQLYRSVVERCLQGGTVLGVRLGADESDPLVGAEMLTVFAEEIVARLKSIRT